MVSAEWWLIHHRLLVLVLIVYVDAQCPWPRNYTQLHADCICAYNLKQELSIQCSEISYERMLLALAQSPSGQQPIDLLYVNNSTITQLTSAALRTFTIKNIQFSNCKISSIAAQAFLGQEETLKNLNLQDNLLREVPVDALRNLRRLSLLDLSRNQIKTINSNAFVTLKLGTLKLADNSNLSIHNGAFKGLENSLKNLNLKGVGLESIPRAMRNLSLLAFLDLAQNNLRQLTQSDLKDLESLTALNLERNLLQDLEPGVFQGVNDTLSSLSLLNNLLTTFPTEALSTLVQLRVLDIGFNLIGELPSVAFKPMPSLTLLALDGNPMQTVPEEAFTHLNNTLRGLSVGGRYLHCDCKMRWLLRWIKDFDLQVTSRERNPQFCGAPPQFRSRSFYQLKPEEMVCEQVSSVVTVTRVEVNSSQRPTQPATTTTSTTTTTTTTSTTTTTTTTTPTTTTTRRPPTTTTRRPYPRPRPTTLLPYTTSQRSALRPYTPPIYSTRQPVRAYPPAPGGISGHRPPKTQPNLVFRPGPASSTTGVRPNEIRRYQKEMVVAKDAFREDNSVIIQWDATADLLQSVRIVYRLFGDNEFKEGPPLPASKREFKIKNVPSQECIVVCVVLLENTPVLPEEVPFNQCKEVRTESTSQTHMDKIIIIASAAICGTVIIAVVVFICCNQRRRSTSGKEALSAVMTPGPPLASLGTLSTAKDWDQMSMYSARSIPRARMYHMDKANEWDQMSMDTSRSIPRARAYSMDKVVSGEKLKAQDRENRAPNSYVKLKK